MFARMMFRLRYVVLACLVVGAAFLWSVVGNQATANPEVWVMGGWGNTDFGKHSVEFSEIMSGGPPKDGIPSIDDPQFIDAGDVSNLGAMEPVISIEIDGQARAYPLRILMWHEIVNDQIGDTPITVTYCPLCNSSIVYLRNVNGQVLDFGTTGKLRNSDLVMYDRQTQSWWQQFLGEAIVGEMTGTRLDAVPSRVEAFSLFLERHPQGRVLVPNNPNMRRYGANPYAHYDGRNGPYAPLFTGDLPDYIEPMARVVTFDVDGEPHAVAMNLLRDKGSVEVGGIVLTWTKGQNSALDASDITAGRDVGNIVAQESVDGALRDIVYDVTFAFVFNVFHPDLRIQQE